MCKDNIAAYVRRISPHRGESPDGFCGPTIGAFSPFMVDMVKHGHGFYGAFFLLTWLSYEA